MIINLSGCNFILRKIPYIGFIFAPFAILGIAHYKKTKGQKLCKMLQNMGATFIKLGQLLSTRSDLIGEELAQELSLLQDKLPAFHFAQVKKIIKKELGKKGDILLKNINSTPVAAASIAQVHQASLADGTLVAVKILRPNIKKTFLREVKFLHSIAIILNCFKSLHRLRLKQVVNTFKTSVLQELDLRFEAAAADQLKDNLKDNHNIHIPQIFWHMTTQKILTIEWVSGHKINQLNKLKHSHLNLKILADNLIEAYFTQAYQNGFFHADLHPGNIIIMDNGKIALIDFGIMGKLSYLDRIYVTQIIYGFTKKDYDYIAKIHHEAGYIPADTNLQDFSLACRSIGEPIFGLESKEISIAKMLSHLFHITEQYGMQTQPQLLLLQKTLLIIEGVGYSLNPNLNMWQLGEPWLKKWAKKNITLKEKAKYDANQIYDIAKKAPHIIDNLQQISNNIATEQKNSKKYLRHKISFLFYGIIIGYLINI